MKHRVFAIAALSILLLAACASTPRTSTPPQMTLDQIADSYVRQTLALAEYDPDYIIDYYGPAEWRDQEKAAKRSLLNIRNVVARLYNDAETAPANPDVPAELWDLRRRNLRNQLGALDARIRMLQTWKPGFDDESLALYDVSAAFYGREDFQPMLDTLDQLLPKSEESLGLRYQHYLDRYTVPQDKLEAVSRAAMSELRQRSFQHLRLPEKEQLELVLVTGKPWASKSQYLGQSITRLEISSDQRWGVEALLLMLAQQTYPGRHLINTMIDDQLVVTRGWREFRVTARRAPARFISDGVAAYASELLMPQAARLSLLRQLFSLCEFDPAEVEAYDAVIQAARPSSKAVIEAARRYRDGQADSDQTLEWLQTYALASAESAQQQLAAFDRQGAELINPVYGEEVIRSYIDRNVDASEPDGIRWRWVFDILTQPRTPHSLLPEN